jgi:hypothetical protein
VKPINICQECGKVYAKIPKRCMCGWYFIKQEVQQETPKINSSLCHFIENGEQCPEAGSVTFKTKSTNWYCSPHAQLLREQSFKR